MTRPRHDHGDPVVAAHYAAPHLKAAILRGLKAIGRAADAITPDDLAPVDEFHTLGREGTLEALSMMPLEPGMHVLDAGCGLGGPARRVAADHGCRVTGIDLTADYVETARFLTAGMGLAERCDFIEGSVLDMPFEDASFDAALSFHVGMNIADRERFYGELARVLRPGAPLCIFDVMKGPAEGVPYPMPWSETAADSHLRTPAETRALLEAAGFEVTAERNLVERAERYYREAMARAAEAKAPPSLGLHMVTGANAPEKFANVTRAYAARQTEPVILVARRR
ncbi:MAG: class I SAM-dependent methyltransferase [Flavobacteriaceae bacterium]